MAADTIPTLITETFTGAVTSTVTTAVNARLAILCAGVSSTAGAGVNNNSVQIMNTFITLTSTDVQNVTMQIQYRKLL